MIRTFSDVAAMFALLGFGPYMGPKGEKGGKKGRESEIVRGEIPSIIRQKTSHPSQFLSSRIRLFVVLLLKCIKLILLRVR